MGKFRERLNRGDGAGGRPGHFLDQLWEGGSGVVTEADLAVRGDQSRDAGRLFL
jgi:hypothetical protein